MNTKAWLLCALALWASACGSGDPKKGGANTDPCTASAKHATLAIGTSFVDNTSIAGFVPVDEGGVLELVHGVQGGFHVEIALRGEHLDNSEVLPGEIRGRVNGELLANVAPWFQFTCTDEGQDSWGTLLIFRAQPEDLHEQDVEVEVSLIDASGEEIGATGTFRIEDPLLR
ncbi:MAG: hypothetical protein ACI8PZ_003077 [Myxococcota bacterium]|jgi:hypothetical protein